MENNTNFKGQITEIEVLLKCLKYNCLVSIPYGDKSRYDLILDYNNNLYRIQIKTSRLAKTSGEAFVFNCYSVVNGKKHKYSKKEIDYFITIWKDKMYLIPIEECSTEKTLWIDEPSQSTCSKADNYLFEKVIEKL